MTRRLALAALPVLVLAAACAGLVPNAPREIDQAAKEFRPAPGMTTVYVFRDGSRWEDKVDDGYRMALELDQAPLGFTVAKSFLVAVVSPGPHSLVSIADNRDELRFEGQPGEIVYVHQGVKYVVSNVTRLSRLDAAVAQPRIRDCRLVSTPVRR